MKKQQSWIDAHVHMYEYFGGVAKILVPDNCKTAVIHNKGWKDQRINAVYHELAEHYGTAIIPARVRKPKDKPNAEGSVGNISTWIVAALRNEQFFTIAELNAFIESAEQKSADVTAFIKVVQKYEHITELTPEIMHELIEKIVVHAPDKSSGHHTQEIEIHYRFDVAVATAVADSMKYDKKRKAA